MVIDMLDVLSATIDTSVDLHGKVLNNSIAQFYIHTSGKGRYGLLEFIKGEILHTSNFAVPQKKKSRGLRSGLCGAYSISSFTPIRLLQSPTTLWA